MQNYFSLLHLTQQFAIDIKALESNYRKIQSASHPDRFVSASPAEKLQSMQLATSANEAYSVLKNPAGRAKYLLELRGINAIAETNTAMPADFLMQQMAWRERLEEAKAAKDLADLEALASEMQAEAKAIQDELIDLFDVTKNLAKATDETRKLIFIDKVCADIHHAIEQIE
ncbi:MAG: Fe-S protein assembly co-chaperone HscB [Betaproteobacteria bacterium HGW-Betaproteobacteria-22]|nr:MAG: Fe-S protein assembly co-chaperone HscB [Betaproteobacteria bacterium HGW-Betaproteobacteria-22]